MKKTKKKKSKIVNAKDIKTLYTKNVASLRSHYGIKKIVLWSVLFFLFVGFIVAKADSWPFTGKSFSWIGNNVIDTNQGRIERGDPVIGMVKMNGDKYKVSIEGTGPTRTVTGAAWFGIGSKDDKFEDFSDQNDLPSLGWILFNEGTPSNNCFGIGDCHAAQWNKRAGTPDGSMEGYLSGWAKMKIGPNGDGSAYPDTWVHFKAPQNLTNYSCSGNHYYVCMDTAGRMEGYAWSAGTDSDTIDGNPGFGWINFNKQFAGVSPDAYSTPQITCRTIFDSGNKCQKDNGFTGEFKFKAVYQGTNDPGNTLRWFCKDGDTPKAGANVSCTYSETGTYQPKLEYWNLSDNKWETCSSEAKVTVVSEPKCQVLVNPIGTNTDELSNYSSRTSLSKGDSAYAMINKDCLNNESVSWSLTNGQKLSGSGSNDTKITVGSVDLGVMTISATAKDQATSKNYPCDSANITVKSGAKDQVRIR